MKNTMTYYGAEVSRYGIEKNRVDMEALGQVIQGVPADGIFKQTMEHRIGTWEVVNGSLSTMTALAITIPTGRRRRESRNWKNSLRMQAKTRKARLPNGKQILKAWKITRCGISTSII